MDKLLCWGLWACIAAGAIDFVAPAFDASMMTLMPLATLLGAVGLVLAVRGTMRHVGLEAAGRWFWLGAGFLLSGRLVTVADDVIGIAGLGDPWFRHALVALGAIGPILLLIELGQTATSPRAIPPAEAATRP
ncbi:MAG: hypothetical protein WDA16_11025 [Candidatus Thermoplasmatota archaeon]